MRVTGAREFRNRVLELVRGDEVVLVTRHGKLSALLVPLSEPDGLPLGLRRDLLKKIGRAVSEHLKKRRVTEEKILRGFDAWKTKNRKRRCS